MALSTSLISFWELNEASGTRNDSHGTNHLTDVNTVTSNTGKIGNCGQFTRANSEELTIASNAGLQAGDVDLSIAYWVYIDSSAECGHVAKSNGTTWEYLCYNTIGALRFYGESSGGSSFDVSGGAFSTSTWYFIVSYHDSVNNLAGISVNAAAPVTSAFSLGLRSTTDTFRIGSEGGINFMDGRIDQVGFWKRVLTPTEITQLYNGGNGLSYADVAESPRTFTRGPFLQNLAMW